MFLDGTGCQSPVTPLFRRYGWCVPVLDFTNVFAASMVFGRGSGLSGAKQTVPRSEVHAEIQALRSAPRKTLLVLISDNGCFVSTDQRGRAHPEGRRLDLWHQYWVAVEYHSVVLKVKSHASEWSLCSGQQPLWTFVGNEFADSEWSTGNIAGVKSVARTLHRRVATVTLQVAEEYSNWFIQVSHVAVPRKRALLEECIKLSAHEIVALGACKFAARSICVSGCQSRAFRGKRKMRCASRCRLVCQPPTRL